VQTVLLYGDGCVYASPRAHYPLCRIQALLLHLTVGHSYTKQNKMLLLLLSQRLVNIWGWDSRGCIPVFK